MSQWPRVFTQKELWSLFTPFIQAKNSHDKIGIFLKILKEGQKLLHNYVENE